jgi:hypothetical protein
VLALTGRPPRTFAQFARDHAGLFRPGAEANGAPPSAALAGRSS